MPDAVARHGHVAYFRSFGNMDRERRKATTDDTIYRALLDDQADHLGGTDELYERGYFQLNDPVSPIHSRMGDHRVWVSGVGAEMADRRARKAA